MRKALKIENAKIEVIDLGDDSLDTMQKTVKGWITTAFRIPSSEGREIDAYVNDEGLLIGMQMEVAIVQPYRYVYAGPMIITASDEEGNTVGLTDEEIARFSLVPPGPFHFEGFGFIVPILNIKGV